MVFESRVFLPEGVCVLFAVNEGPIIAFAALDLCLSFMLLFLFAYPLHRHLKTMSLEHDRMDDKLLKLMKKNMILSTLITSSTFCNLLTMV